MSVHRRLLAMVFAVLAWAIAPDLAQAAEQGISIGLPAMTVKQASSGGQTYSLTLQVAGEHIELPEIDVGLAAPP